MNARSFQAIVQAAGNRSTVVIVDQFCEHQSLVSAVETVKVQRKGLVNLCKVECFQCFHHKMCVLGVKKVDFMCAKAFQHCDWCNMRTTGGGKTANQSTLIAKFTDGQLA